MALTVEELARRLKARLQGGEAARPLLAAASLADAGPNTVAALLDPRYAQYLSKTKAGAVLLKDGAEHPSVPGGTACLYSADPEGALLQALAILHPEAPEAPGVDAKAHVESGVALGKDVYVGPFAVLRAGCRIGDGSRVYAGAYVGRGVTMGANCRVHPQAVLYDRVELGNEVIVHAGTVVGADGFGYKFRDGAMVKVPQVGGVKVGDRVEIGANSAVDRGALSDTRVGEGTKIDNLVQVGHNVQLGRHVVLCGQAGVAGSAVIHDYVLVGAQVGIADHLTVGMAAKLGAKAGLTRDAAPQEELFGYPADGRRGYWRQVAALKKLPELLKRVKDLEAQIETLKGKAGKGGAAP